VATAASLAGGVPAMAASPDRVAVPGSHPAWAAPQAKTSAANPQQAMTFRVYLNAPNGAEAANTARAVSDPSSPQFRHNLSAAQVKQRFAPSTQSVDGVRNWLQHSGFRTSAVPANRAFVEATGDVAQAQRAFGVQLNDYRIKGQTLRAADTDLTVPATLSKQVLGVVGVDQALNLLQPQHTTGQTPKSTFGARSNPADVPPGPGFRNAGPCSKYFGEKTDTKDPKFDGKQLTYAPCGYKPGQLRSAYGIDKSVENGVDGHGTTVAIVDAFASPTIYQDASTYAKRNDPAHPLTHDQFSQIVFPENSGQTGPEQCDAAGWYGEETLDVESVHAMAPGANILYVGGSDCQDMSLDKAVNDIVANHRADIISNSYGDTGEDIPAAEVRVFQQISMQAVLEGIGMYFSSGDNGDEAARLGHPSADFSASSPWVTAVGGTSLAVDAGGNRDYETGWQTGKHVLANGAWGKETYNGGAGGGTSVLFKQPFYQRGTVPDSLAEQNQKGGKKGRVVPDIAALADPNTGMLVGQTQTFPDGVYYDQYRLGGTSLACPLVAGIMAVSDQKAHYHHGFINPVLYSLTSKTPALHDIQHVGDAVARVDYANSVDGSGGLITSARTFDYDKLTIHTTPGYDNVTGLGSPNGNLFLGLS
jgi:subtilase family serine protease